MIKNNNKGFSLVELIIAMAIMTLLITPILVNLAESLNVSAKAKEKQYAVDNAGKVVNFFQKTDVNNLVKGSKDYDVDISDVTYHDGSADSGHSAKLSCKLYTTDSSKTATDLGLTVNYTADDYILNSSKLGRKQNTYVRTAVMDDLNNVILSQKGSKYYEINYDLTKDTVPSGFTLRNDGSAVKVVQVTENGATFNHVTDIIVKERTKLGSGKFVGADYENPNDVNIGNVQDLDSNKVAIIQGYETSLDQQFESDMISKMMSGLSKKYSDGDVSEADYNRLTNQLGDYFNNLRDNRASMTRMIKISSTGVLKSGTTDKIDHYHVSADVYYQAKFNWLGVQYGGTGKDSDNDLYRYNIFSQDFYTSTAPDIYLYYEPFVEDTAQEKAWYAYNDYIAVYGDQFTSTGSNPSNVYLLKAKDSWQSTAKKKADGTMYTTATQNPDKITSDVFYTYKDGSYVPVNIHINQIQSTDTLTAKNELPLHIYTNFDVRYGKNASTGKYSAEAKFSKNSSNNFVEDASGKYIIDNSIGSAMSTNVGTSATKQFICDSYSQDLSGDNSAPMLRLGTDQKNVAYDSSYVLPYMEYESKQARLYSVTVDVTQANVNSTGDVTSLTNNKTSFTGAKGAN